jgi:hypothetical protein
MSKARPEAIEGVTGVEATDRLGQAGVLYYVGDDELTSALVAVALCSTADAPLLVTTAAPVDPASALVAERLGLASVGWTDAPGNMRVVGGAVATALAGDTSLDAASRTYAAISRLHGRSNLHPDDVTAALDAVPAPPTAGLTVVALPGGAALVAAVFAATRGACFTTLSSVAGALSSVLGPTLIIGPSRAFDTAALLSIAELVAAGACIGIEMADSAGEALRRATRRRLLAGVRPGPRLVAVDLNHVGLARAVDPGAQVVGWGAQDNPAPDSLLLGRYYEVVGLEVHSDNIDANVAGGLLCGKRSLSPGPSVDGGGVQTCLVDDRACRRDPQGALIRVPIDQVQARVIVAEACSFVAAADGLYARDLGLAASALAGWATAVIAPVKAIRTTGLVPPLASALLSWGRPFGEVAAEVSARHRDATGDQPSWVLMGDPTDRFRAVSAEVLPVDVKLAPPVNCFGTPVVNPTAAARAFARAVQAKVAVADGLRPTHDLARMASDLAAALDATPEDGDRLVATSWPTWDLPHYFVPFYAGILDLTGPERDAGPCPRCRRSASEFDMTGEALLGTRVVTQCPRCGIVSDRPGGTEMVGVDAPDEIAPGDVVDVVVRPVGSRPAAVCLDVDARFAWFGFELTWPTSAGAPRVEPGDAIIARLRVDPASKPGIYHLVAVAVADLAISLGVRPLTITGTKQ